MGGKFEIKPTADGRYLFNLKAGNGQVVLTSQTYGDKASARGGIESVRRHALDEDHFERRTAVNGSPYFVLVASNHEEIGRSEIYTARAALDKGIASVRANAADARIIEIET